MEIGRAECNEAAAALISGAVALSGSSTLSGWLGGKGRGRGKDTVGSGAGGNGGAGRETSSDSPAST